jgi:hypothetical protein
MGKKKSPKGMGKKKSPKGMGKKKSPKGQGLKGSGMKFSDVVGSLLSPSLPDSRDLKDKLHAAVDNIDNMNSKGYSGCGVPTRSAGCAKNSSYGNIPSGTCASPDYGVASNAMPYGVDMNDYIKKDSIPCYGCNL